MLNLQKLEQRLDAALAIETPESLTSWLLSQRAAVQTSTSLTDVEEVIMSKVNGTFRSTNTNNAKYTDEVGSDVVGLYDYAMAA